jgi:hypothetical protein
VKCSDLFNGSRCVYGREYLIFELLREWVLKRVEQLAGVCIHSTKSNIHPIKRSSAHNADVELFTLHTILPYLSGIITKLEYFIEEILLEFIAKKSASASS